jgi:hypothetical protein
MPDLPIVLDVWAGGGPGGGTVQVHGTPDAWLKKDTAAGYLTVSVCGECGHAELQVGNSAWLYEKYEKSRET